MDKYVVNISKLTPGQLEFFGFQIIKEDSDSLVVEHIREGYICSVDKTTMLLSVQDITDAQAMGF